MYWFESWNVFPEPAEARMIQCRGADWTSTACFGATAGLPDPGPSVSADAVPWDALEREDDRGFIGSAASCSISTTNPNEQ